MSSLRKVLVIGSGGREHALSLRLLESPSVREVVIAPGNAGTASLPPDLAHKSLRSSSAAPLEVARAERPDLVVVGPEAPLCDGLVDQLTQAGFLTFGPSGRAAQLEGSKAFTKDFAARHGINSAPYVVVRSIDELPEALARFDAPPVVKADGLCAGKGVVMASSHAEAEAAARSMLSGESFGAAGQTVVLESRLQGAEVSMHAICDGERFIMLPAAQDHKRIGDGDQGPNTGGMGTYAPAPLLTDALTQRVEQEIIRPVLQGMAAEGNPFRGALFAGLMVSPTGEPQLLEFNVRFGDPETQVITSVLDGDFAEALAQAAAGALRPSALTLTGESAVCIVLAAAGYPGTPRSGDVIDGLSDAAALPNVRVFHAGTRERDGRVVTSGGRVLGVTARGASLQLAHQRAYEAVARVRFDGMQFRRDIAARALT
ncbi:MAG: phosphoribosylamine--glycine ligase [Polyangiaceae bacterium]